jgi:hypothetical protein
MSGNSRFVLDTNAVVSLLAGNRGKRGRIYFLKAERDKPKNGI